MHKRVALKEY